MTLVGNSIADLVGKTPLVKVNRLTGAEDADVYLKLEYFNPGASVKDRIASTPSAASTSTCRPAA